MIDELVQYFNAAKNGDAEIYGGSSNLYCWENNQKDDESLKTLLEGIIFDPQIHPAYIAIAVREYRAVYRNTPQLMQKISEHQGDYRTKMINALLKGNSNFGEFHSAPTPLPKDIDFIDGPANIRNEPKGKQIASLPDNTKVRILQNKGGWYEIEYGELRGWTYQNNLMGRTFNSNGSDRKPALSRAAYMGHLDMVRFLLAKGADINCTDELGRSALHWAVMGGLADLEGIELEILKILLSEQTRNLNLTDGAGSTPLLLAIRNNRNDMAELLLAQEGIDVNRADGDGVTPLVYAIIRGDTPLTTALLATRNIDINRADAEGKTPLYHASARKSLLLIEKLLSRQARTDTVTAKGESLYHAAFESKSYYNSKPNIDIIKLLLQHKEIDINHQDRAGNSPLSLAISNQRADILELMVAVDDLDVNRATCSGDPCLSRVLHRSCDKNYPQMALLLLNREDIDVNVTEDDCETPAHMDWCNSNNPVQLSLAKKILAKNPDLEVENDHHMTPLIYNILYDKIELVRLLANAEGIDLNHTFDPDGYPVRTPLALAKSRNKTELVKILQEAGASEYQLLGDGEVSPEGIPQALLQNDEADGGIRNYRGYLINSTDAARRKIDSGELDEAIRMQEFILDEIISEEGGSMPRYSAEQRAIVRNTFELIQNHYSKFPRVESKWFKLLPQEEREIYNNVDTKLSAVLTGKYNNLPEGDLKEWTPTIPILILRKYMAENSIKVLNMIRNGQADAASRLMVKIAEDSNMNTYWREKQGE